MLLCADGEVSTECIRNALSKSELRALRSVQQLNMGVSCHARDCRKYKQATTYVIPAYSNPL